MRSSEDCARSSRRWGVISIGTYAVFIGASALIGTGILHIGNWFHLVIISGIVCIITTGISLGWWTQCDVANGRFFSHPGRSALIRFVPGLILMCAYALPLDAVGQILFISGFIYSALALICELFASIWARNLELFPPLPIVSWAWATSLYALMSSPVALAAIPDRRIIIGVGVILLACGGFAFAVLWQGSRKGNTLASPQAKYFYRSLTPRERLALMVCAVLDFLIAAFALWAAL